MMSQCVCNSSNEIGDIHKWYFPYFISPISCSESEWCDLSSDVVTNYSCRQGPLLPLTGQRHLEHLQPPERMYVIKHLGHSCIVYEHLPS